MTNTPTATDNRLVLKITATTTLKRRIAPEAELAPNEKVSKDPCRIFLHSYAYAVPGEDLQNHYKVCLAAPFMGSSVWYISKDHCVIENPNQPQPAKAVPATTPAPVQASAPATQGGVRKTNQAGLDLVKNFEGLRLEAYLCPAKVVTIGYGSTFGVKMGDRITREEAEERLKRDLSKFETAVQKCVTVPLTDNQFAALVAFTYNVGPGALQKSTLLKLLNARDYDGASKEFLKWNKAGGKVLNGLTKRRVAEQALFLKP